MNKDDVNLFKSELKVLRILERKVNILKTNRERLVYLLQGVRGLDPSREPSGGGKDKTLELIEAKSKLDTEIEELESRIKQIYATLDKADKRQAEILVKIYADDYTIAEVAEDVGYSESQMKRIIDRIIMDLSTRSQ